MTKIRIKVFVPCSLFLENSFVTVNSATGIEGLEENGRILTGEYVCGVSNQPMDPVEYRSLGRVRMWSECREYRLEERQDGGDDS